MGRFRPNFMGLINLGTWRAFLTFDPVKQDVGLFHFLSEHML